MTNANLEKAISEVTGESDAVNHWITVKQYAKKFEWPSESALRSYINKASLLGIEKAFLRFQRRVLINPKIFFDLIQDKNTKGAL